MQKSFVFATVVACATAWTAAASYAADATLDQFNDQPAPCANGSHCGDQLNPQPLPPGNKIDPAATGQHIPKNALNPQPLPPGIQMDPAAKGTHIPEVQLNPQPLPPGRSAQ